MLMLDRLLFTLRSEFNGKQHFSETVCIKGQANCELKFNEPFDFDSGKLKSKLNILCFICYEVLTYVDKN